MLIPLTSGATLIALALAILFWGVWANTFKAAGKWRFEIYYYDFAVGTLVMSILLALTLGSVGSEASFTFEDNLTVAGKRQMGMAVGAGFLLNLASMLIFAGLSLAGLSVAPAVGFGVSVALGAALAHLGERTANPGLLFGGVAAAIASVVVLWIALAKNASEARKKTLHPGVKGFILSCVGGLLLPLHAPVLNMSMTGDLGLGPYPALVFIAIGVLFSTLLVNVYFLNLPVEGRAISMLEYFKGTKKQHLLGLLGGFLWCLGTAAALAASAAPAAAAVHPVRGLVVWPGAAVVAALCGIIFWKERAAWTPKASTLGLASLALLAGSAVLLALSVE